MTFLLALIGAALADPCGMVPPAWVGPSQPGIQRTGDQETYVFFADGMETIAIRPAFQGSVDEFGMLIPVPAAPALRKISDATFQHLAAAVDPPSVSVDFYDPNARARYMDYEMSAAPDMPSAAVEEDRGAADDFVRVINQEAMGMYEVAVLEAGSPKALERWMTERDFRYPDGMDAVVLDYVKSGWLFVAVKTKVGESAGVEPRPGMRSVQPKLAAGASFTGSVQGMAFRFRVDKPVVPMRLSTFNGDTAVNRVYFVSDRPVRIQDRPTSLVRRQVAGTALHDNLAGLLPVTYTNGTEENVPAAYRDQLKALRDPTPHNGVAKDLIAADLLALRTQTLSLPFEKAEKQLLNINESLGLRGAEADKLVENAVAEQRTEALAGEVGQLGSHTLTVFDGDFGQSWLRDNNLTFTGYRMPAADNSANNWRKNHNSAGYLSIPVEKGGSWWPF